MRINVYAEEMTDETAVVTKTVTDDECGTRTFYGVRVFMRSPSELHHSDDDDDRTALTFWFKASGDSDRHRQTLHSALVRLLSHVQHVDL